MAVKVRRFRIRNELLWIRRWILRKTRIGLPAYHRVTRPDMKPISKLICWGRRLTKAAKSLCSAKPGSGYDHLGPGPIPEGHSAVYVGQKDEGIRRVVVPVIYFNHPLFGQLLQEAEEEYGFCQQGALKIPCPFSDFESIHTRIQSGSGLRRRLSLRTRR